MGQLARKNFRKTSELGKKFSGSNSINVSSKNNVKKIRKNPWAQKKGLWKISDYIATAEKNFENIAGILRAKEKFWHLKKI